jgi:hypothetical protein
MGGQQKDTAWKKLHAKIKEDGNGSGSCPLAQFCTSSAENFMFYY